MEDYDYIFRREHRDHRVNRGVWERSRLAYGGGEGYIRLALIRHLSEIDLEFEERLKRAYYFNYPRKIARIITQYILSVEPSREGMEDELAEDFSRDGRRVNEVMRQFSTLLNIYGSACLLVEMPYFEGEVDVERKKTERIRPFARALSPLAVVDYAYGSDGKLEWLLIEEEDQLDGGPFLPSVPVKRRKLFTRDEFYIFEKDSVFGQAVLLSRGTHGLGMVPAVLLDEPDGFGLHSSHYFEDVVRISDAILNNESEAQMNMVKQMFGLLVISDSFARNGRHGEGRGADKDGTGGKFSHVIARSAAIWESPEERGISRYISPSGADTRCIREENLLLKRELFDIVGMAAQTDSRLIQSAESKSWDHHNVRQFLACRADLLEQAELTAWTIMAHCDHTLSIPKITYNRDFSVIDLEGSIRSLLELDKLSSSVEYHREIERTGLFLLEKLRKISPEQRNRIIREIELGSPKSETEAVDEF